MLFSVRFLFMILLAFDVRHRSHHLKSAFRYRVQGMKFRTEEQSDLNDILLRVSAFGLFIYAVFSVIAGALNAFTHEPNLLVMITGLLSIAQVRFRSPHIIDKFNLNILIKNKTLTNMYPNKLIEASSVFILGLNVCCSLSSACSRLVHLNK